MPRAGSPVFRPGWYDDQEREKALADAAAAKKKKTEEKKRPVPGAAPEAAKKGTKRRAQQLADRAKRAKRDKDAERAEKEQEESRKLQQMRTAEKNAQKALLVQTLQQRENNCFMNAAVHTLSASEAFRDFWKGWGYTKLMRERGVFVEKVWNARKERREWREECIGEFTRHLIQRADRPEFPTGSFGVQQCGRLWCSRCKVSWQAGPVAWDPMLEISLGDGTGTVQAQVDSHFARETRRAVHYSHCTGGMCSDADGRPGDTA